jgi:hypothetical protein
MAPPVSRYRLQEAMFGNILVDIDVNDETSLPQAIARGRDIWCARRRQRLGVSVSGDR